MLNKIKENWGYILFSAIFLILPAVVGLIFWATLHTFTQFEAAFALFGIISILLALLRSRSRDSKNFKKNKTLHEDKKTDSYKQYRFEQWIFYITGLVDLLVGGIMFLIFR